METPPVCYPVYNTVIAHLEYNLLTRVYEPAGR